MFAALKRLFGRRKTASAVASSAPKPVDPAVRALAERLGRSPAEVATAVELHGGDLKVVEMLAKQGLPLSQTLALRMQNRQPARDGAMLASLPNRR
ncbi:MAG: hypothetical protein AAGE18_00875 [Pseudomonadota bacterium]